MSVRYDIDRTLLDPEFDADVYDILAGSEYAWVVTFGFRTFLQQKGLYTAHLAGGPLAAPQGHSAHEFGLAVDVAILSEKGPSWDESGPEFPWLWAAVAASPRMHSGHGFQDDDHIQAVKWQQKKAELKTAGAW